MPNYAWLIGIGTAVGAFWSQAKSILNQIVSTFLVSTVLESETVSIFTEWAYGHLKASPFSPVRYQTWTLYVIPKEGTQRVLVERLGESSVFFHGLVPIFIANKTQKDGSAPSGNSPTVSISYFRFTFDIKKVLIEAHMEWNAKVSNGDSTHSKSKDSRYMVRRLMGSAGKKSIDRGTDAPEGKGLTVKEESDLLGVKVLGWERSEIGSPKGSAPFEALAYNCEADSLLRQLRMWSKPESRRWHKERLLSWRMGAFLYGPPGTGKTSIVRAFAQELGWPVFVFDLSTMYNHELVNYWENFVRGRTPCIVLMEDIDRLFGKRRLGEPPDLTLDCLLNCISGMEPTDGILTFATANDLEGLDPALGIPDGKGHSTRPGRFDVSTYFGEMDERSRVRVATRILDFASMDLILETVKDGCGETGAQFVQRCSEIALQNFWEELRRKA